MRARAFHRRVRHRRGAMAAIVALAAAVLPANAGAGDRAFGEYLSGECVTCHQTSGRSPTGIPSIVAWPDDQFIAVLKSYKEKHRDNPVMQVIAGRLSDEEMAALAAYFGSLPAKTSSN
jgi:cytochrome c553